MGSSGSDFAHYFSTNLDEVLEEAKKYLRSDVNDLDKREVAEYEYIFMVNGATRWNHDGDTGTFDYFENVCKQYKEFYKKELDEKKKQEENDRQQVAKQRQVEKDLAELVRLQAQYGEK